MDLTDEYQKTLAGDKEIEYYTACGNCEADLTDKEDIICWNCNCVIDEYGTREIKHE